MAHNPQAPQGVPDQDPAGSTQMFQAFVNEEPAAKQRSAEGGSRTGLIVGGVVAAVGIVLVVVALLVI